MRATSAAGVGAIGRMRSPYDAAGPARTALFATCEAMRMRTGPSVPPTVTVVGASIPRRPSSATNAARSRLAPGDSSLASSIGATIPRSTTSAAIALAIVDGAGASANSQAPLRPLMGSGAGRVRRTGTWATSATCANGPSPATETPTTTASARSSTTARRSSRSSFDVDPATSTNFTRSFSVDVGGGRSSQSCIASRCGPPLGARLPERSRSTETFTVFGSRVGAGVGETDGVGVAHPINRSATRARARMALGARAVGERVALRVHVAARGLGARVGLGLGLRDGGLDLGVKIRAYLRELVLAGADLEEVAARVVYGILRHPLAHFLFGAVARVVVVGRVWLEAIALQLDERRTVARPRDRDGLFCLRVRVEHVHAVGDETRHRIRRRLVGDVLRRHLPLEPRRDREEVVLDDEHHRQLVHRREVRGLREVARARRPVAAERDDGV